MPNLDSFRHVIIDSVVNVMRHDTSAIKVTLTQNLPASTDTSLTKTIFTAIGASLVTALSTYLFKRKEFKGIAENLRLQKEIFEENKKNTSLQLNNELAKVQDLKNRYQLSLDELDFSKYGKVLDLAEKTAIGIEADKLSLLKDLNSIVRDIRNNFPPSRRVEDIEEANRHIAMHILTNADKYRERINAITASFPHLKEIKLLEKIEFDIGDIDLSISDETGNEEGDWDVVFEYYVNDLVAIYSRLKECFDRCFEEFNAYDKIKKEFIEETLKKKNNNNDPATT